MKKQKKYLTKKNPLVKSKINHVSSHLRSRATKALACHAAKGDFVLQECSECQYISYPPRDRCPKCWGVLTWKHQKRHATLLAETTIHSTTDLYFREHVPWRIGTILLDVGPTAFAHLHSNVQVGDKLKIHVMLDRSGNPALFAMPRKVTVNMEEDYQYSQFTASPKGKRILISDGRTEIGQKLTYELIKAGAEIVYLGNADSNLRFEGQDSISKHKNVKIIPLNLLSTKSVKKCSQQYGGKVDILINTASYVRSGSIAFSGKITEMQNAIDLNVNGLTRLAKAFCPAMSARSGDEERPAIAFLDILSIFSLTGHPGYASLAASSAARLSIINSLRSEMSLSGLKVFSALIGPIEDEWHQDIPPPKVTAEQIAKSVITSLKNGQELTLVGNVAKDIFEKWSANPLLTMRETIK